MGRGKRACSTAAKQTPGGGVSSKENKISLFPKCLENATVQSCANPTQRPPCGPLAPVPEDNSPHSNGKSSGTEGDTEAEARTCLEASGVKKESVTKKQAKPGNKTNKMSTDRKIKDKASECNRKVTDFYPIRRSCRKSKAELKCEKQQHFDDLITNNVEEGLKVKNIEGKGRGVFAEKAFYKDQFIAEYHGDLLEISDAKARESKYAEDPTAGCYMYYFRFHDKTYCVDATKETDRLGRLINHSKNGNLQTKLHDINGVPHLMFLASRDIRQNEELLYDYGDRSREAVAAHPWLKH